MPFCQATCFTQPVKGSPAPPKQMNFWKSSKRPLTPPPYFRKIILQFFPKFMTEVSSIMAKICNINFLIENDPPLFGTFPKIHSFWRRSASLTEEVTCFRAAAPKLKTFLCKKKQLISGLVFCGEWQQRRCDGLCAAFPGAHDQVATCRASFRADVTFRWQVRGGAARRLHGNTSFRQRAKMTDNVSPHGQR